MNVPRLGSWLSGGALALLVLAGARPVIAQQDAVISGKVTSDRGDALNGATVTITGTNFGAQTGANGAYTIRVGAGSVHGQTVTLTARFLGYKPTARQIVLKAGTQEQNFTLSTDPLRLEEMVVTGVSEATSTRKLTFAVGKVSEDQLQEVPGTSALQALQGKVSGVRVETASGEPGTAPSIRLRGPTSIGGSQDPLIIVDGVIVRATLADIAGEDIERIEVVKGAAASALYGSDAANGVVQIFTKRGKNLADGKLQVTARVEGGSSQIPKFISNANAHAFLLDANGDYVRNSSGSRVSKPDGIADNPYKTYYDQAREVVHPGALWQAYMSIGQRKGTTNFNASFQEQKNDGIIAGLAGYDRQNFRLNVDQGLAPRLDASFSAFYGQSKNGRATQGVGSPFFGLTFLEPDTDINAQCTADQVSSGTCTKEIGNPDGSPYRAYIPDRISNATNPLYTLYNQKVETDRTRFTGSAKARWRITDYLNADGSFNYDQEEQRDVNSTPFGFYNALGQATPGSLNKAQYYGRTYNTNMTLTYLGNWGKVVNTSKAAYIYEDQSNNYLQSNSGQYIVKGVPEFSGVNASLIQASSTDQAIRNQNFYLSTGFDINDRYLLDGLVRRDGSSLFGPNQRWQTYYRVSGAWRVNEDLKIKGIDEWRIRAAYGTAGLRPGFAYQYEVLTASGGAFSKTTLGNKDLRPAKSAEMEIGTNLDWGGGKYTFEYSYAKKKTNDQILLVDLPAALGFANQWQNTGSLESTTHEVAFGAQLLNKRNFTWQLNIVGDRTRNLITEWNLPERLYGYGQMPQTFYLAQGVTLGEMRGQRAVKCGSYGTAVTLDCELYDDPAKKAASGPGQKYDPANYIVNEEGFVVAKSTWRTVNERPIDYVTCSESNADGSCKTTTNVVKIGDANPDFRLSFSSMLNYKRLAFTIMVDWSQGGSLYNGTRQWPFFDNRDRIYDQRSKPVEERKPQQYYNYFYNGLNAQQFFIESATYVKLKELAVNYTFNKSQLGHVGLGKLNEVRLGLVGRNLLTFTHYSGYDPEVSDAVDGDPFQLKIDWFQYPHMRTLSGVVEIAF